MKSLLIIFLSTLSVLIISCKSENEDATNPPRKLQNQVLPPETKSPQETIQKQTNIDPKLADEIIEVIKENLAATQAKDKDRVLKTIHKECPQRSSTIEGMDYVFKNYDMVFNLEKVEVIEISGDEAKVYYEQTTRAIRGQGFPPNRSTGIHILKKENGKWKIFKTEYLSNEPIR